MTPAPSARLISEFLRLVLALACVPVSILVLVAIAQQLGLVP